MDDAAEPRPTRRDFSVSVRTRIVAIITTVTALGLLAVGVSVGLVERHRILENVDQRLLANLDSARFIVGEGAPGGKKWASSTDALTSVVKRMSPDDHTGALGMHNGKITIVPGMELDLDLRNERNFASFVDREVGEAPVIGTYAQDGRVWRYLAVPISVDGSPAPQTVVFVMVYDLDAELAELDGATRMFLLASGLALLVVAAASIVVATRLLRPLRQMRETAERISAESLAERLPVVGNDDVAELTVTINDMLDRLDSAVDAQRRLLSDVGHELKTPLTIIRGNVELMDVTRVEDIRETRTLVLDELDRMNQLVQDLGDASALYGRRPLTLERVDLSEFFSGIVRKARGIDGAEVSMPEMPPESAAGQDPRSAVLDPARITQALLQLVQNAVTHGGGQIELGISRVDSGLEFSVRDHGSGVADEAKAAIFERFHRGRDADSRAGSGLGLNIVEMIARAHRGTVEVRDADGGGAVFLLRIPEISSAEEDTWHRS